MELQRVVEESGSSNLSETSFGHEFELEETNQTLQVPKIENTESKTSLEHLEPSDESEFQTDEIVEDEVTNLFEFGQISNETNEENINETERSAFELGSEILPDNSTVSV